jgi:hypothetical protein
MTQQLRRLAGWLTLPMIPVATGLDDRRQIYEI